MSNESVTVACAASFLGMKPRTLDVWRVLKKGPPFLKIGRSVRYSMDDLRTWVASRRVETQP